MKKILHISTYYYPQYGGIEQVAYDIVDILKNNKNIENRVICFSETGKTKEEMIENIKVYKIGYIKKIFSQAISIEYFFKLKKIINDYKPNYIHLHLPNPLVAFYVNKILNNNKSIKLIVHWHSDIIKQKYLKKLYSSSQEKTLKNCYKILTTSYEYGKKSKDLEKYSKKIEVIQNIVNEKKLIIDSNIEKKIQEFKEKNKNNKVLFFIGVHREYKGLKYLIEASKYLDEDYKIYIGGIGPLTEELKNIAKKDSKIIFLGKVSDEEKIVYLNVANLFAFPSITKNEAFGIALAEALYFGIPAITFKIEGSGVNWVNKDGETGIEVKEIDSKKYALGIQEAFYNRKKFSLNAKKWIKENFVKESIEKKLLKIYE